MGAESTCPNPGIWVDGAEGCWDKILRHGEYQARSMDSGTEGQILNQISRYVMRKLGPKSMIVKLYLALGT